MAFSPLKASRAITAQYRRYLSTVFQIRNPEYRDQFTQQLEQMRMLSSGPFLDVHDNFATGASTRQLVEEGVLPRSFLRLGFMHDRPLYMHQEQAVRRVLAGRNLVVSTGTGSGKTESFLIPILASLAQECEQGRLSRGVRALLVYPMNALANDQVERLRALLQDYPEITFGCYTGQTQPDYERALHEYRKLNRGAVPARNELISRDEMKQNPPHLLKRPPKNNPKQTPPVTVAGDAFLRKKTPFAKTKGEIFLKLIIWREAQSRPPQQPQGQFRQ